MPENQQNKNNTIRKEFERQTLGYIVTAFSLVVGLAWNDVIKNLISYIFPLQRDSLWMQFLYVLVLTVVAVIITHRLRK